MWIVVELSQKRYGFISTRLDKCVGSVFVCIKHSITTVKTYVPEASTQLSSSKDTDSIVQIKSPGQRQSPQQVAIARWKATLLFYRTTEGIFWGGVWRARSARLLLLYKNSNKNCGRNTEGWRKNLPLLDSDKFKIRAFTWYFRIFRPMSGGPGIWSINTTIFLFFG